MKGRRDLGLGSGDWEFGIGSPLIQENKTPEEDGGIIQQAPREEVSVLLRVIVSLWFIVHS